MCLQLSMRRDLVGALGALERPELDLAFGNPTGVAPTRRGSAGGCRRSAAAWSAMSSRRRAAGRKR
jgi:hypothetical protein